MRIQSVLAEAFGPFSKERLNLAPGMNIIHGPNEAGKSSWFAATRAGLCGIRRARGRGTKDEVEFKARHMPWRRRGWRVGVVLTLDDGRRLELMHNLARGASQLKDLGSGQILDASELENEGATDGSRLLGLNRTSARATIFVGQADILRVVSDAGALQDLLQRAATSHTADTTVEGALKWLEQQRRERVGQPHLGQRPLGMATKALEDAREATEKARDAYDDLLTTLGERKRAADRLAELDAQIDLVKAAIHWKKIDSLDARISTARILQARASQARGATPVDELRLRNVTEALGALRDREVQPEPPSGETAAALRTQLEDLPESPDGDVEVHPDVAAAYESALTARAQFMTHDNSRPPDPTPIDADVDPEELRSLAQVLALHRPVEDLTRRTQLEELRRAAAIADQAYQQERESYCERVTVFDAEHAEYTRALAEYEETWASYEHKTASTADSRRSRPGADPDPKRAQRTALLAVGVLFAAVGIGVAGALNVPVGLLLVAAGLALVVAGTRFHPGAVPRRESPSHSARTESPPPKRPAPPKSERPGPPPSAPTPDPAIASLEAELRLSDHEVQKHDERRAVAVQRLSELALPADSTELKRLAGAVEARAEHEKAASLWRDKRNELAESLDQCVASLIAGIRQRDPGVFGVPDTNEDAAVDRAVELYRDYERRCRARGVQGARAARRADLKQALATREAADRQHADALRAREAVAKRVAELARGVGLKDDSTPPEAALSRWLDEQQETRERVNAGRQAAAQLGQLLDGATLPDLESELQSSKERAASRPETMPDDPDEALAKLTQRREIAAKEVAELGGQAVKLESHLPPVAEAIEREAEAERRLDAVQQLARIIDFADKALRAAKDKVNASIAPALRARILPWLPRVTGGRYTDLVVDPANLIVRVRDPDGGDREATVMSHGTMEQIYLLVRLALADLLATRDETAPVILDDVTVQSDPVRTVAFLELLHEISRERQVVFFTQEQVVVEWAEANLVGSQDRRTILSGVGQ